MGCLLSSGDARLVDWDLTPIAVVPGQSTGGLYRLYGTVQRREARTPWSLVLKIVSAPPDAPPIFTQPDQPLYWKREICAYQSGLLDSLKGGLDAARCFDIAEQPDGSYHLWLEDLFDNYGPRWPLDLYARTARVLGRFNGAYLVDHVIPQYSWLVTDGIAAQQGAIENNGWLRDLIADRRTWEHPLLRSSFPATTRSRLLELWDACDTLFDALVKLPQTLCHLDAWQANLFYPPTEDGSAKLVAIDWASIGRAPLGVDPGDLLSGFGLFRVETTDPGTLDATIFGGYLNGLRDAGWQGDPQHVRFAYAAYTALKYTLRIHWLADVEDESKHRNWEIHSQHAMSQFLQNQGVFVTYLLDLADEAFSLL